MSILDNLKEFVRINLNFNINLQFGVKTVNLIADPKSDAISVDERIGALNINWSKLPPDKIEELKPLISGAVREQGALLIESESKERT